LQEDSVDSDAADGLHEARSLGRVPPYAASIGIAQGLIDTARLARLVQEPARFTLRQAQRRRLLGAYRLRGSGIVIFLRHNTPDVNTLDEIFRLGHYEPPAPVLATLGAVEPPIETVDLGANIGLFGAYLLERFPNAKIVAFEPDEANAEVHERSIEANGAGDRWQLLRAAATSSDGTAAFSRGGFTTGRIEAGNGEQTVVALDVFPYLESVDLLKIDIEGAEWELLADPRFAAVPAKVVALEYHPHLCPADDPRRLAHDLLRSAAYETADHDVPELLDLPGHGMVWGWKTR
jgi:FkbM family methyltransferase